MGLRMAAVAPGVDWLCPQLPASPAEAMRMLLNQVSAWSAENMAVVGSSLGGFYATYMAEQLGCKAVLLNPAVHAARDLTRAIGEQSMWHTPGERFYFKPDYVDELRAMELKAITRPERYYAVIAKGDEVLDWREMSAHYPGCAGVIQEDGDHALSNFDEHLPGILRFLNLSV
jgi:predicted esterase YcpF (UPF0227 family)